MTGRRVPGWGALDARLCLIGEAPGSREVETGRPFAGQSGQRLEEWWKAVGLTRAHFRIENVCEHQPEGNDADTIDQATWESWFADLHRRLAELRDPYVLVPTGNYALYAITGKGKVHWHQRDGAHARPGILDWRGSILEYVDAHGRVVKCLPTIHPAATFRAPDLERPCREDWRRIAAESTFKESRLPARIHHISPTLYDLEALYHQASHRGPLAIDIENPPRVVSEPILDDLTQEPQRYKSGPRKGRVKTRQVRGEPHIVCIGFALDAHESWTVPTTEAYWGTTAQLDAAWAWIKALCELPCEKVLHNGLYDVFFLADRGIQLANWVYDTLLMHHALDPSAPHALDYCASVDTREPFWKHEAKDPDQAAQYLSNWQAFLTYNGKDVCVTRELCDVYLERLASRGQLDFYLGYYPKLLAPLHALMRHGIRVDDRTRRRRLASLLAECIRIQDELETLTGVQLYANKSLSTQKIQTYLYETLKLPRQTAKRGRGGQRTTSADEVVIRKLMQRYPAKLGQAGGLILQHRRQAQLAHFYRSERVDRDGRFRSSYSPNTEAGRLSSSANPRGTGSNAQNVDREARDVFLPDAAHLGVEVDLSQAEARINYLFIHALTGDRSLLEKARLRPDAYDQHTENAVRIFGLDARQATQFVHDLQLPKDDPRRKDADAKRYLGKKAVHAGFRGMRGHKLSDELLKEGYTLTPSECDDMIRAFQDSVPGIEEFFRWIRREVILHRVLKNSWGFTLWFTYDRLEDETYRRAYSFHPQSEVAFLMNLWGLVPMHDYLERTGAGRINAHVHDSLFMSLKPEKAYDAIAFLVKSLEAPRLYTWTGTAVELEMPCEVKVGRSWKGEQEWKRLPDREAFEEVSHGLQQ